MSDPVGLKTGARRGWLLGAAVGVGASLVGAGAWWWLRGGDEGSPENAAAAQLWTLPWRTPAGLVWDPAVMRGQRVVVNFWAPWCPPCVEEMPLLNQFYRAQRARGWWVVGVALDRAAAVEAFLLRNSVDFPIVMGGMDGMDWARRLGNVHGGLPFTVVLDRQGRLLQRRLGRLQAAHLDQWAELE